MGFPALSVLISLWNKIIIILIYIFLFADVTSTSLPIGTKQIESPEKDMSIDKVLKHSSSTENNNSFEEVKKETQHKKNEYTA